jgi:GH25 family lysozyme M1 (1,4-beta-N-acetylmuramidase)
MGVNAQGIDGSSNQAVYTAAQLRQYDFAFFRASDGTTNTDPHFAANWAAGKAAAIHRGAYHELTNLSAVSTQAQHFIGVVRAQGVLPGDMMAVVASDYPGVTGAAVLEFAEAVKAAFPHGPVLVYSDLSAIPSLGPCTGFPLWLAEYGVSQPEAVTPWGKWTFWQSTGTGQDRDTYNGTPAELQAWLNTFAPSPSPNWTYGPPQNLTVTGGDTSAKFTWAPPAGAPTPPASYLVSVYNAAGAIVPSYPRTAGSSPYQGGSLPPLPANGEYTVHVAAQGPNGTHVKPGVYATAKFKTG